MVEKLAYAYTQSLVRKKIPLEEVLSNLKEIATSETYKFGENPSSSFVRGIRQFLLNKEESAQFEFMDSGTFQLKEERFHISRGAATFRGISWLSERLEDRKSTTWEPKIEFQGKGKQLGNFEAVQLTCADSVYFQKFGPRYCFESLSRGGLPHIHLINPNKNHWSLSDILSRRYGAQFSFENSDFLSSIPFPKGYLINPRYALLPRVLERYSESVLVTDIDAAPIESFGKILEQSKILDAGLRVLADPKKGGGIPWKRVAAVGNLFFATQGGYELATMVSVYISSLITPYSNRNGWLLDQNALSTSFSLAEEKNIRVGRLLVDGRTPIMLAQHMPGGKEAFVIE